VRVEALVADAAAWDYPSAAFDLAAWIYLHLAPPDRVAAASGVLRAMKPGGLLMIECFSPAQTGRRSGGPKDPALLWTRATVDELFGAMEVLELLEGTVALDEGPRHQGPAEVVRALLRKR
jgi:SAM-dependent methyltransferase